MHRNYVRILIEDKQNYQYQGPKTLRGGWGAEKKDDKKVDIGSQSTGGSQGVQGSQAQAPASAPLGKYAFAPERTRGGRGGPPEPGLPEEENTEYEKKLLQALQDHLGGMNDPLSPEHTKSIKDFMKSGYYKNIFKPAPASREVWRGVSLNASILKKFLKLGDDAKIPYYGRMEGDFLFTPRDGENYGSSWTVDYATAGRFAGDWVKQQTPIKVVFTAAPGQADKFLKIIPDEDNPVSGLYRIIPDAFTSEEEVLALGPIKVSAIEWTVPEKLKNPEQHKNEFNVEDSKEKYVTFEELRDGSIKTPPIKL